MSTVGKNVPHDSAVGHVTGESLYVDDMPFAKNELIVDFFWSPVAHGRIRALDTTAACTKELKRSPSPVESLRTGTIENCSSATAQATTPTHARPGCDGYSEAFQSACAPSKH